MLIWEWLRAADLNFQPPMSQPTVSDPRAKAFWLFASALEQPACGGEKDKIGGISASRVCLPVLVQPMTGVWKASGGMRSSPCACESFFFPFRDLKKKIFFRTI